MTCAVPKCACLALRSHRRSTELAKKSSSDLVERTRALMDKERERALSREVDGGTPEHESDDREGVNSVTGDATPDKKG